MRWSISIKIRRPVRQDTRTFMRAVRWALAKLVKIPWAVSGRKYATDAESDAGPTFVWNIKLKSRGGVRWPASPVAGDGILL